MAKRQIKKYVYNPGIAGSAFSGYPDTVGSTPNDTIGYVVIPAYWNLDRILLITNVTRGVILFNFADTANTGAAIHFNPGGIRTNVDTNLVTYGRDPAGNAGTAAIQNAVTGIGETTIYFTNVDTSSHSSTDVISVLVEENYVFTKPWSDFGTDAIERARVALPESLIDADFEYGLQPTKWQGFQIINNYPSIYEAVTPDLVVTDVATDGGDPSLITVSSVAHGLSIGDPFTVQQLLIDATGFGRAQGGFLVYGTTTDTFTYYAKGQVLINGTSGSIKTNTTVVRKGGFYSGSDLPVTTLATDAASPSTITLTFSTAHGFVPGMPILVNANPSWGSNSSIASLSGDYFVSAITGPNSCQFVARGAVNPGGGAATLGNIQNYGAQANAAAISSAGIKVYARPDGFFLHRPGDGGVILGTNSPVHGAGAVRQSKKYFRYQSGKGILYTTGVLFAPNYDITQIWYSGADGTTAYSSAPSGSVAVGASAPYPFITCVTGVPHGLQVGCIIRIVGVATAGYDGQYTVETVADEYTIKFRAIASVTLGSGRGAVRAVPKLYMYQWHGACIRTGPHDDANGMFFEYDGKYFNVVKRTSTLQLAGTIALTPNSNTILGNNTLFTQQLKIGDKVVIKGMVHRVTSVTSDTNISVSPDFRGVNASVGNYMWIVQETRVGQPDFNLDTVDGNGGGNNPSGYKMDPNRMQMVGIQFTWYGAGFMDFMVRGIDGNFILLHRMKQNNINVTASMRSANLPVRYQVINEAAQGVASLITAMGASDTTLAVALDDVAFFPTAGNVLIENEIVTYTNVVKQLDTGIANLTGLTRAATYRIFVSGSYRDFTGVSASTHATGVGVEVISQTATPTMSHWGSSYIMDGGFDYDRGYQFTYSVTNANIVSTGNTVMGLRLSPSASNSTVGDLGDKELLNRAQILLQSIEVASSDQRNGGNVALLVTGTLNPSNYSETAQTWNSLNTVGYGNQPSFSQVTANAFFTTQTYVGQSGSGGIAQPGEKLFEFVVNPQNKEKLDLSVIKELAQSGVGGRGTFPNGADTLFITIATLPGATTAVTGGTTTNTFQSNVHVTLQWGEAQA